MSIGSIDDEAALRAFIQRELESSRVAAVTRQLQNPAAPAAPAGHAATHLPGGSDPLTGVPAHAATHLDGAGDPVTVSESMMAAGALGPLKGNFSAYRSAALTGLATNTAIIFDAEEYDVSGWFNTTNGRYTPTIACRVLFNWYIGVSTAMTVDAYVHTILRKNGANQKRGSFMNFRTAATGASSIGMAELTFNGTSDYADIALLHNNAAAVAIYTGSLENFFQGRLLGRT